MLVRLKFKESRDKYYTKHKKSLFIIPYLFTYLNAIFGFLSIVKSVEEDFVSAALFILLAAVMDACDGRLARALGSSSYFGMELDSLCDAISFCLAPAILLYSWLSYDIPINGILVLAFYLCAGLARLAKFNLTSEEQSTEFIGLPTTMAASFIATLIIYSSWLSESSLSFLVERKILIPIIAAIALLMISPVKFYSFKKSKFRIRKHKSLILLVTAICSWLIIEGLPLPFLVLSIYIISCILINMYNFLHNNLARF